MCWKRRKAKSPTLSGMFARYADCLLAQMVQAAACNATHAIEQRTAKWIVSAMERTGDLIVPLTQEQLASMLGVGRSYASRVIGAFQARWAAGNAAGITAGDEQGCARCKGMPLQ